MIHVSSRLTYLYKFIIPIVFILLVLFATYGVMQLFKYDAVDLAVFILIIIAFLSYFGLNNLLRLKNVSFDKENLYINNFKREEQIVLSNIDVIKRKQIYFYEIIFKEPTSFGHKIVFMPKFSEMADVFFLSKPKSVNKLEGLRGR